MEPCDTVPLALVWALGWNFQRFGAGLGGYWDAPIFHGTPGAFALSEPIPLVSALAWPLHLLGASLATAFTAALVTQLVANGVFVRRWLVRLGVGRRFGTLGGAIAVLLPFVHQELGVLPLVSIWGPAWMFTALLDLLGPGRGPRRRAGVELGIATCASWLCSAQMSLFALLLLGPCAVVLLRRRHLRPALPFAFGAAGMVVSIGVLPFALSQRHVLVEQGLRRSDASRRRGSSSPADLMRVPWPGPIPYPASMVAARPGDRAFNPGLIRVGVAAAGVGIGLGSVRWRRRVLMLLVLIVGSILLALGQHLGGAADVLADLVPGYDRVRSVFRAIVFAQMGVVAAAMVGLRHLEVRLRAARRRAVALRWGLSVLLLIELLPPPPRWTSLPGSDPAWVRWLRDEAQSGSPIAWLPFASSRDVCAYEPTARLMVLGLTMDHPLVNGYSSYIPGRHRRIARDTASLGDARSLQRLRGVGTRWIVSPDDGPLGELDAETLASLGLVVAMHDDSANVTIYEVEDVATRDRRTRDWSGSRRR